MPDSMYDRLGTLLSDALESGSFFADTRTGAQKSANSGGGTPESRAPDTNRNDSARATEHHKETAESAENAEHAGNAKHEGNVEKGEKSSYDMDKSRQFSADSHAENEKYVYKNIQAENETNIIHKTVYKNTQPQNDTYAAQRSVNKSRHLKTDKIVEHNTILKKKQAKNDYTPPPQETTGMVYKAIPHDVQTAFTVLGLPQTATPDEAKKAYHEKLKYYHPDRHGDNPVLQKVAREKTHQVIEAWATLERYFT